MPDARVAYLVKRFPRLSETFILGEFLELRRLGLDLVLYALDDPQERVVDRAAAALVPEVRYLHGPGSRTRSWVRLAWGAVASALRHPVGALRVALEVVAIHRCSAASLRHAVEGMWLARDLRRRGTTRLHAHFAHSPAVVAHMCRLAGGPVFGITAHAKDLYTTPADRLRRRLRAADVVLTCTHANARHVQDAVDPHTTVHVVHHGIDVARFSPAGRCPQPGVILTVGRMVPKKGYDDLLDAVAHLHADGAGAQWEIIGSGPLREPLEREMRRRGVADRVVFRGAQPQDAVLAAYRRAAVFALAPVVLDDGDRDGIPNVLVEAMACGVPVVATRVSGVPELITDGVDGLLVPPHDPEALAAALRRILGDAALATRLGAAARCTVAERFDRRRNALRVAALVADWTYAETAQDRTVAA